MWMELRGHTCGSIDPDQVPQVDMSSMNSRRIMRECLRWEEENPGHRISCFTIRTQAGTDTAATPGSARTFVDEVEIHPVGDDSSSLFVRILVDDGWRFIQRHRAPESNWVRLGDADTTMDPIKAIRAARAIPDIRAFRSDGWYTTSNVTPDQVNIHEFGFSLPYHGTWVRTGTT